MVNLVTLKIIMSSAQFPSWADVVFLWNIMKSLTLSKKNANSALRAEIIIQKKNGIPSVKSACLGHIEALGMIKYSIIKQQWRYYQSIKTQGLEDALFICLCCDGHRNCWWNRAVIALGAFHNGLHRHVLLELFAIEPKLFDGNLCIFRVNVARGNVCS